MSPLSKRTCTRVLVSPVFPDKFALCDFVFIAFNIMHTSKVLLDFKSRLLSVISGNVVLPATIFQQECLHRRYSKFPYWQISLNRGMFTVVFTLRMEHLLFCSANLSTSKHTNRQGDYCFFRLY